jgi:hypothetical protein
VVLAGKCKGQSGVIKVGRFLFFIEKDSFMKAFV